MIRRIISICMLWLGCLTLWGQSTGGYGGDYNPTRPADPTVPATKYRLTITATEGGTVSPSINGERYVEGTRMWVRAYNETNYKFVHWLQNDMVISTNSDFYYYTQAEDVELKAVFKYVPGQYGGDYKPTLPDDPQTAAKIYNLTVECSPANVSGVDRSTASTQIGKDVWVETSLSDNYKFEGWWHEEELVSTELRYRFKMEGRDMHLVAKFKYAPKMPGDPTSGGTVATRQLRYSIDGYTYRTEQLVPGTKIQPLEVTPVKRGYTFKGWGDIPEVMPNNDVTISGTFDINKYKIKFTIDGKSITKFLEYGAEIVPPDVWPAEGEVFKWIDMPATMPNKDIVVNGEYTPIKYTLIYILDGKEYRRKEYKKGEEIIPLQDPVKEGYIFSGWSNIPATMPATYVVVNGSFIDPNQQRYQVTFKVDGEVHHIDSVTLGSNLEHLKVPEKVGHTYTITNEIPIFMPKYDITIEGTFITNSHKLTYMVDGVVYKEYILEYGTPIAVETPPTLEGSAFTGWSEIPTTMPDRDVIVTGAFILNGYTITYIVDGEVYEKNIYTHGKDVRPLNNLSKEGYTFSGWSEIPETMPNYDITVVGSFTINTYKVTYMVNGSVYHIDTLNYGTPIVAKEEPIREGYTFSGWSEIPEKVPANDVIINGIFTINGYRITYTVDGMVYETDSIEYGERIIQIDAPIKEGYTFSGWSETPRTMPANDVIVSGTFAINSYKITYIVDGSINHTETLVYGDTITVMDNLVREGYTFSGWSEAPKVMPANDITITGSFTINKYKITYMVEGLLYESETLEYGAQIIVPEFPVKEGYTFSGWGEIPQTMPANDVVAEGNYLINKYQITYVVEGKTIHTDYITYNEKINPIEYPEKEGFTFSGWIGIPAVMPASDVTTGGEFFIKTTQTDEQGLIYTFNETSETFEVSNYTDTLVAHIVIPNDLYGYTVSGIKERALMGAEELISVFIPQNVSFIGSKAFFGSYNISYIEWKATAPVDEICFDEPARHGNLLVYVENENTEVTYKGNVIVNGIAEQITITNEQPLRNIRNFTARNISFTREFTKRTKIGEAGGWEAIIIPFDVETIVSENRGELKPFGIADFTTSLPYWIAELQADGSFAYIESIKANSPFIMEVPNSDEYRDIYNVEGKITFSAKNTTVYSTDITLPTTQGYAMMGSYEGTTSDNRTYALNDEEYTAGGVTSMPGSVFVANSRDIRPFEAYVYSNQVAPAPYLRIGSDNATGIGHQLLDLSNDDAWYTLQGVRLNGRPQEKGTYIHQNKVVFIK